MKTDARAQQAPESYATFWEPLPAGSATAAPAAGAAASGDAKDAYLEFVNVTEGALGAQAARA